MQLTLDTIDRAFHTYQLRLGQHSATTSFTLSNTPTTQLTYRSWTTQHSAMRQYYADSSIFASFIKDRIWVAPYFIANLISNGPLRNKELSMLDVGCHHANILKAMEKLSQHGKSFNVKDYTGLDISQSAINNAQSEYPEHNFIAGDALDEFSYRRIQDYSKNLITCCGVCDYLPPSQIKLLLSNLVKKLSREDDARIYLTYRTLCPQYGLEEPKIKKLPRTATKFVEDGVPFYGLIDPSSPTLTLYNYHPDNFNKLIDAFGLEVVKENSRSCTSVQKVLGSDYDYVCLRRKKPIQHFFPPLGLKQYAEMN